MEAIFHIILKNLVFRISYSQPARVKIPWLNQEQKSKSENAVFLTNSAFRWKLVQSNLSIADMLHSRHLVIADTFLRNWQNHVQTLIEKPLYSEHFYSRRLLYWAPRGHFGQNFPLNREHLMIGRENRKHAHVFVWHISWL